MDNEQNGAGAGADGESKAPKEQATASGPAPAGGATATQEPPKGPSLKQGGKERWLPTDADKKAMIEEAERAANAASPAEQAAKLADVTKLKETAWKEHGFIGRFTERVKQNFSHDGGGMKFARVAGTAIGGAITFLGAKTLLTSPELQEGQEAPSFASRVLKGGAQLAAGIATMLFSLTKGGQARALRMP